MATKKYSVFGLNDGPDPKDKKKAATRAEQDASPGDGQPAPGTDTPPEGAPQAAEAGEQPRQEKKKPSRRRPRRKPKTKDAEASESQESAISATSSPTGSTAPDATQQGKISAEQPPEDGTDAAADAAAPDAPDAPGTEATATDSKDTGKKPSRPRRAPRKAAKKPADADRDDAAPEAGAPKTSGAEAGESDAPSPDTPSATDTDAADAAGSASEASASRGTTPETADENATAQDAAAKKPRPAKRAAQERKEDAPAQKDTAEEKQSLPPVSLEDLSDTQKAAVERAGWEDLMPVQKRAIPYLAAGRDIMVQARTGSGKTGGFVLPLLDLLDKNEHHCQALILVPTRELAQQVAREATMLAGEDTVRVVAAYGGVGYKEQLDAFREGAQLVVGTPGRILDHLMRRTLTLDHLKVLIFDEADRMLSVGFYPDMKAVQRYLPSKVHGCYMFSATYPYTVLRLADEFLQDPEMLSLSAEQVHVTDIDHQFCEVPPMGKERRLVRLIELENPSSAIVFCNTKRNVEFVTAVLQRFGYDAEELSSSLSQGKRESVLGRIREGRLRFLVATDVAARGIDIPELSHVFLYEPPEDPESYIHRAGRTGRAGASGTVISLVDLVQKAALQRIASRYGIDLVERKEPEEADVIDVVENRLTVLLEKKRRELDKIQEERITRFHPLARKLAQDDETLVLLGMFLDELYQSSLNAPAHPVGEKKRAPASGGGAQQQQQQGDGGNGQSRKRKRRPRRRKRSGSGSQGSQGSQGDSQ